VEPIHVMQATCREKKVRGARKAAHATGLI
jgi:hypothetical protein